MPDPKIMVRYKNGGVPFEIADPTTIEHYGAGRRSGFNALGHFRVPPAFAGAFRHSDVVVFAEGSPR